MYQYIVHALAALRTHKVQPHRGLYSLFPVQYKLQQQLVILPSGLMTIYLY